MNRKLAIGGAIVAGVILVFGFTEWQGRRKAREDLEAQRQDSIARVQLDSGRVLLQRKDAEIASLRAHRAQDSIDRRQLAATIGNIAVAYSRLSTTVTGITQLLPRPGTSDTAEIVGPRTKQLIDSQRVAIAELRKDRQQDSLDIVHLFSIADSLKLAARHFENAYDAEKKVADIYKRQRYGWKDRVTASVCYEPVQFDGSHVGGGACYTVVRPLRAIDSVTDLVRRIF